MNQTKVKPSTDEGWAVHVYDSDRHLRFTLESSHIWAFGWGIGIGILSAFVWSGFYRASHSFSDDTDPTTNPISTSEINSEGNSRVEPANSIPLGID